MGSGKREKGVIGKIPLDREVNKINMRIASLLKINIPIFHTSIFPCAGQKLRHRKKAFILNKLYKFRDIYLREDQNR